MERFVLRLRQFSMPQKQCKKWKLFAGQKKCSPTCWTLKLLHLNNSSLHCFYIDVRCGYNACFTYSSLGQPPQNVFQVNGWLFWHQAVKGLEFNTPLRKGSSKVKSDSLCHFVSCIMLHPFWKSQSTNRILGSWVHHPGKIMENWRVFQKLDLKSCLLHEYQPATGWLLPKKP